MVPLEKMPELDLELKEKRTSIEGLAVSPPKINNETNGAGVFIDKLKDIPSDSDSSGSSSTSCSSTSGSDSEMDSDPIKLEEESPCEDIYSFNEKNEEDSQTLDFQEKKVSKKTIKSRIPRKVGRVGNCMAVQCGKCGKHFKKQYLKQHIREVHNSLMSQCGQCGKQMKKQYLRRHIQEVHNTVVAQCGQCGKQMKKRSLGQHIRKVHSQE